MNAQVRVAVGVVTDDQDRVLLALRPLDKHQGGLWEFPGGKIEPHESVLQALSRELFEELGIEVVNASPLMQVPFNYPGKSVLLDVWTIDQFNGMPSGREGQEVRWVSRSSLSSFSFPLANRPIVNRLRLPSLVAITGEFESADDYIARVDRAMTRGAEMIVMRPSVSGALHAHWHELLPILSKRCNERGVLLSLSSSLTGASPVLEIPGLHLTASDLMSSSSRPLPPDLLLGASCHDALQLAKATQIGVDYVFLSPVLPTPSHPGRQVLGWSAFSRLAQECPLPVLALGGIHFADLALAQSLGAKGVASLRDTWF